MLLGRPEYFQHTHSGINRVATCWNHFAKEDFFDGVRESSLQLFKCVMYHTDVPAELKVAEGHVWDPCSGVVWSSMGYSAGDQGSSAGSADSGNMKASFPPAPLLLLTRR